MDSGRRCDVGVIWELCSLLKNFFCCCFFCFVFLVRVHPSLVRGGWGLFFVLGGNPEWGYTSVSFGSPGYGIVEDAEFSF